ncbi:hypothetical protein [Actibacterium sp. XHP0104]|uniref:hypothetical protein n=1 Tax=Actibacterium sp. XHP0104 TaxID=2984335 RepID=UPI0021E86209|nr:hypothetical protein [Actibacterium sp. XHP0104]MCV2881099.1 hypothetical protein [Actibacterium sp. XHP0104]
MTMRLGQILTLPDAALTEPLALAVGLTGDDLFHFSGQLSETRVEYLPLMLIHAALARAPWAETVITPLVAEHFDAMDMAAELALADYRGTYAVLVPPLPRPAIIRRELAAICPGVHIELWTRAQH